MARQRTKTRAFGASRREGHDSTEFYSSKLYEEVAHRVTTSGSFQECPVPGNIIDSVICKDSRDMSELPDNSVHLMITSPPYNASKEYDADLSLSEYRQLLKEVFAETYRVLVPGGRACVNIANLGRKPYIPVHAYIAQDMLEIGYLMRGEIIWDKAASSGASTAWGSWMSASNPTLRDVHEYILVFSKAEFSRPRNSKTNTISKEEFLEYTKSIWQFPTESARKVGHPAPFPVELPYRLIQLYSFQGDVVLDPFCGSGTTAVAAVKSGRHYVCYDIDPNYVALARNRIAELTNQQTLDL